MWSPILLVLVTQDLSLLTNLSEADIMNLQSVGKEAQNSRREFILRDDQDKVWEHMKKLKGSRVDFILDNGIQVLHCC
jgi:damage-control phosphatase, subfamily III